MAEKAHPLFRTQIIYEGGGGSHGRVTPGSGLAERSHGEFKGLENPRF